MFVLLLFFALYALHQKQVSDLALNQQIDSNFWQQAKSIKSDTDILALLKEVGSLSEPRSSSFLLTSKKKPNGIQKRVGVFGDSIAWGDGVEGDYSLGALLQKAFNELYPGEGVEVVLFANKWHGLHQAFRIYETLADDFEIDIAVFLNKYDPIRDLYMNHSTDLQPYYLHGKYILNKKEELEFVLPTTADEFKERFYEYNSFIPNEAQLFHDARVSGPLRTLERLFGLRFDNPLLPQIKHDEIWSKTFYAILNRLNKGDRPVVYLMEDKSAFSKITQAHKEQRFLVDRNLAMMYLPTIRNSFFWDFGHLTEAGNSVLASVLAKYLRESGSAEYISHELNLGFSPASEKGNSNPASQLMRKIQDIEISIEGDRVAEPRQFNRNKEAVGALIASNQTVFIFTSPSIPAFLSIIYPWKNTLPEGTTMLVHENKEVSIPISRIDGSQSGYFVNLPNGFQMKKFFCQNYRTFKSIILLSEQDEKRVGLPRGYYGFHDESGKFERILFLGTIDCKINGLVWDPQAITFVNKDDWIYFRPTKNWRTKLGDYSSKLRFLDDSGELISAYPIAPMKRVSLPLLRIDSKAPGWPW